VKKQLQAVLKPNAGYSTAQNAAMAVIFTQKRQGMLFQASKNDG
jgi:hypothetical protein